MVEFIAMSKRFLIKLPNDSLPYILFQRTGYLKRNVLFNLLTLVGSINPLYKLSVYLKSWLFANDIKREYSHDINYEFSTIKKFLPKRVNSILDIGCGMAGIDVLISRYYRNNIDIFLIDKTRVENNVFYQFEKVGAFYNSLTVSKAVLELNGIETEKIHYQEATQKNEITFKKKFDVVLSLISWGFHYPVSVYINQVFDQLSKGGILILDVRKHTGGEEEIIKKFGSYSIIIDEKKFVRILAKKK